jgi:hypothetical protein
MNVMTYPAPMYPPTRITRFRCDERHAAMG